MRYAILAAALAAGVVAVPYNKRDLVLETDVVYETQYVTVTAGQEPAATTIAVTTDGHYGHHSHDWPTSTYVAPPAPTSTYVQPAPEPSSTYVAPPPATTEAAPAYSAPASSAPAPAATDYAGKVVDHHNYHRANHSAPAISWDDGLASTAAKIAASCQYKHNTDMDGKGYGQNIAAGAKAEDIASVITEQFYNGEVGWFDNLYGQSQPDMTNFRYWGHFSQIVWKGTSHVGCATQDCSGQPFTDENGNPMPSDIPPYFTVCNYKDPGNFAGEYGTNVGESLNHATIDALFGL